MEKRIFLAIVISIGFLLLWANVAPRIFPELAKPEPPKPVAQTSTAPKPGAAATSTVPDAPKPSAPEVVAAAATPVSAASVQRTVIDMPAYRAVLSNRGAQLVSFKLKKYSRKRSPHPVDLVTARDPNRTDFPFAIEAADPVLMARLNSSLYAVTERSERGQRVIEFRYSDGRVTATKTFRFRPEPYLFDFSVSLNPPAPYRVAIGPGIGSAEVKDGKDAPGIINGNGVVQRDGKFKIYSRQKGDRIQVFPGLEYIGIEDNYFLTVLRPSHGGEGLLRRMAFFDANKQRRDEFYAAVNAARDGVVSGDAFFGPKETALLDRYGLSGALQFGIIARFLLKGLIWFNQYTHNYGWAIIVLTIIIKIVLYPLQHKQNVSMKKMQRVAPKIEAIKAKYKKAKSDAEQRQKMNVEVMQLYQKEGINPMAGCLPLVLQLPILWGFYNLLSRAIELRGAPWILWIKDLSEKDPTYVLPILMTGTMFLQTYLMPATGDPAQRKIFLFMPLVFGFFFKDFPSGLVLYWLVQNILTIIQQLIMNRWWKNHPDNAAPATS
jgi:YidC/Oxa1 family membrane protein insertase